jgi:teichoic acid transport system permease protein
MLFYNHYPSWAYLQLPLVILAMFLFATAWSIFSSPLSALSRDFHQVISSLTMCLFWVSGVIFNMNDIEDGLLRKFLFANPITFLVKAYRNIFIHEKLFFDTVNQLIVFLTVCFLMLFLGVHFNKKLKREILDVL